MLNFTLGSFYNYDDAVDGQIGSIYNDFYTTDISHFLLNGNTSYSNYNDSKHFNYHFINPDSLRRDKELK
jgi:hypothetical protein